AGDHRAEEPAEIHAPLHPAEGGEAVRGAKIRALTRIAAALDGVHEGGDAGREVARHARRGADARDAGLAQQVRPLLAEHSLDQAREAIAKLEDDRVGDRGAEVTVDLIDGPLAVAAELGRVRARVDAAQ